MISIPHHQVVGKCSSSEAREFTGENTNGRHPVLFRVMWLVGAPKEGLCFCGCGARSVDKKCTGLSSKCQKLGRSDHFWIPLEDEAGKGSKKKDRHVRSGAELSPLSALCEGWSTWCDATATAMRVCNWLWQNALTRLCAAKHEWSGIVAGGCQTHCNSCAKGSSWLYI